ncbi:hypothetical protein P691DRAFT_766624 [Macrolepiota fuliginosa MF-IS2]|uniref:Uncharacterized protein n=1 Tax=Macrolepiota fuliginosa MF-IS2 TaxID=1400762 RepID=A0A9P6BWY4_9AGAR|nr:hypothetical protein P691DRAFT_766624 [Macrolepiota fuliginosa MF-IS2]
MASILRELHNYPDHYMTLMTMVAIGFLLTGGLITLGISSVLLLAKGKKRAPPKQHYFLCIYVIALLLVTAGCEVGMLLEVDGIITLRLQSPHDEAQEPSDPTTTLIPLTQTAVYALTEGLLTWRYFMIYQELRHSLLAKCGHIVWIFIACLWVLAVVTGFISDGLRLRYQTLSHGLGGASVVLVAVLNLYATMLIMIVLLRYRRMVRRRLGNKASTAQHLPIIVILLESAVIGVPATIALAVGVFAGEYFGLVIAPIAIAGHAFSSVLIIHQVALGRAFDRRREEQTINEAPMGARREGQGPPDHRA